MGALLVGLAWAFHWRAKRPAPPLAAFDASTLTLGELHIAPAPASSDRPPLERFRAEPEGPPTGAPVERYSLARLAPTHTWAALGHGYAGPLGSSFETTADGRVLWLARPESHALERWDLVAGTMQRVPVPLSPAFVAIAPTDPDRLAFSQGDATTTTAWLYQHGNLQRLGPAALPLFGLDWSDDGRTLLLHWDDAKTHLLWLRTSDGAVGLDHEQARAPEALEPQWVAAPGGSGLSYGGAWWWSDAMKQALPLPAAPGVWTFAPALGAIAGLEGRHLYLQTLPQGPRLERELTGLGADFVPVAGSLHWRRSAAGDRLDFEGEVASGPIAITLPLTNPITHTLP